MSWENPYIIVRVVEGGSVTVVHQATTLKDARYWLTYISEIGDAIFTTPLYKHHKDSKKPSYMAHLLKRGDIQYSENAWRELLQLDGSALFIEGIPIVENIVADLR